MEAINVLWLSYHQPEILARGYWDNGLLEDLFKRGNFQHHEMQHNEFPVIDEGKGAVVVINGRTHFEAADIEKINANIAELHWCVFIVTGDEEALFPWQDIKHPLLRTWVMLPRMNQHNDVSQKLPNGYRPETRPLLKKLGQQHRTLGWFFCGQVTHERREQCADELRLLPAGELIETHEFGGFGDGGLKYKDYIKKMASAKIIPCPSGPESPDSFRVYEALEAGCLPVVDAFSTQHKAPGFWHYLFGDEIPFPIVDYWDKLPQLLPQLLRDWPSNANRASAWWQLKKRELYYKLIDDIAEVSK